jgi:hypothetical protein
MVTVSGLEAALVVKITLAVSSPTVLGVTVTSTVH